ncbi:hypothetical protein MSUIS_02770 [Mycoplasma suis KI3806]|uniref:Uncharacterized protein n=1 Tax=Mycoplasma suis (strain KI_3806) TaxID=708248 RepID=F0V3E8_MYCS3|nr:hypothetical protein [Mycoplasma suis]CBZ40370.1 hypothetical protein MSUIS_02770 [Mycoplasma suis KI3806]
MLSSKLLLPILISAGTIAGGGVTFLVPERKPSEEPNAVVGSLDVGINPFANAEGKPEEGSKIGAVTLQKDSWKYKSKDQDTSSFTLIGEKESQKFLKNAEWKGMVQNTGEEEQKGSEKTSYLERLGGKATFYVKGLDCREINRNFIVEPEESLKDNFNFRKEEQQKNNESPIKFLSNGSGISFWSCHQDLSTLHKSR